MPTHRKEPKRSKRRQPKPLTGAQRCSRLKLALDLLEEFAYGLGQLRRSMGEPGTPATPTKRFYVNALYQATANFYLVGGQYILLPLLREYSLDREIEAILQRPMGPLTFRAVLAHLRDKALVHTPFLENSLHDDVLSKFNLREPDKNALFFQNLDALWEATLDIRIEVAQALMAEMAMDHGASPTWRQYARGMGRRPER